MDSTEKKTEGLPAESKKDLIVGFADEIKAEQIEVLDVRAKTSVADYFVICTGTSDTHMNSILDRVVEKMKAKGIRPHRTEAQGGGWILVDFGDVVFHVFREERRQFFDLETLWNSMQPDPNLI